MDQLKEAVAAAFDKVVASGAIEEAIHKQIGAAVTAGINEHLRDYSDFGKALKEKIGTLIEIDLDTIDLPSYRQLVGDIIKKRVGAVMSTEFTEKLDKDIAELLAPAPATITLQELLDEFIESKKDAWNAHQLRGEKFTLNINRSDRHDGYIDISIDEDPDQERHTSCAIHLRIRGDGEVWGLSLGGADIKNKIFAGPLFNFEKRLFQMYTAKTRLIIDANADADDFETTFPYNDND
jgi:hypothetical protein